MDKPCYFCQGKRYLRYSDDENEVPSECPICGGSGKSCPVREGELEPVCEGCTCYIRKSVPKIKGDDKNLPASKRGRCF